jgi:hypothetical protein
MDIFPEVITKAALDHCMGEPVVLVRLDPDTLEEARRAIARLREIGEEVGAATGSDLAKLDEEATDLREALSDMFTAALEEADLVQ